MSFHHMPSLVRALVAAAMLLAAPTDRALGQSGTPTLIVMIVVGLVRVAEMT